MTPDDSPLSKLQGTFGQDPAGADKTYGHAQEAALREAIHTQLSQSPTGHRLLHYASQQKVIIKILKGREASGYIPESRAIFISFPPDLSTPSAEMILDLAAYLRQAELHFLGHKNPDLSMTSHDYTIAFDSKMIDSIAIMCRIASELKEIGKPEFVDALARMGHAKLYEAYSNYGQGKELVDAYYSLVEKKT